jgi:WD40 repeat protein
VLATATMVAAGVGGVLVSNERSASKGRETLMVLQSIKPASGWSRGMWGVVTETAERSAYGLDRTLQSYAARALSNVDAGQRRQFRGFGADQVIWDREGRRLLMSTISNADAQLRGVHLWDKQTGDLEALVSLGPGPIAFSNDAQPLQLNVADDGSAVILRELHEGRELRRFYAPDHCKILGDPAPKMNSDGSYAAAVITRDNGIRSWAVWQSSGDERPKSFEWEGSKPPTCFALSEDGSLLAAGDDQGHVTIYSVSNAARLSQLRVGRFRIHCLTFERDRLHRFDGAAAPTPLSGWILATGDAGGHIGVWDLQTLTPRAFCHGSLFDVYGVAFSPDGMTLASSGRGPSRLWDLATGRLLLDISANDFASALAFSPDGNWIAIGSEKGFADADVSIWKLDRDRGIQSLRGLAAQVTKLSFSADEKFIAALAQDWQIGVWNVADGHLRGVFEVPPGLVADNAAICFNKDGSQLAFCSGKQALLFETTVGRVIKRWELPDGIVDLFAYTASDRLLLIRYERTEKGRVVCIRNLLASSGVNPLAEIADFSKLVYTADVAPTGEYLIVDGIGGPNGDARLVRAYDLTGKLVRSLPTSNTAAFGGMAFDETGKRAAVMLSDHATVGNTNLIDLPSGIMAHSLADPPFCMATATDLHAAGIRLNNRYLPDRLGLTLFQTRSETPLITFDLDVESPADAVFGPQGTLLAWGQRDGTLCIANLPEVKERLGQIGLGW